DHDRRVAGFLGPRRLTLDGAVRGSMGPGVSPTSCRGNGSDVFLDRRAEAAGSARGGCVRARVRVRRKHLRSDGAVMSIGVLALVRLNPERVAGLAAAGYAVREGTRYASRIDA